MSKAPKVIWATIGQSEATTSFTYKHDAVWTGDTRYYSAEVVKPLVEALRRAKPYLLDLVAASGKVEFGDDMSDRLAYDAVEEALATFEALESDNEQ